MQTIGYTLLIAISFLFISKTSNAEDNPVCTVTLKLHQKEIWTLEVQSDRIIGSGTILFREGNIVYGFIGGNQTRCLLEEDRIVGRLAEEDASLAYRCSQDSLVVRGPIGKNHLVVEATDQHILFADQNLQMKFKKQDENNSTKSVIVADESGVARLEFDGCTLATLRNRVDLALLLHQLILPRVAQLKDVRFFQSR